MRFYSDVLAKINRSCAEFVLHNAEAFLNFPSALIDFDDFFGSIVQICRDGIESVIAFFFSDLLFINAVNGFFGNFALTRNGNLGDETLVVSLFLPIDTVGRGKGFLRSGKLFLADFSLIIPVENSSSF